MYLKFAENIDILVQIVSCCLQTLRMRAGNTIGMPGANKMAENYFSSLYFIVATSKLQPSID